MIARPSQMRTPARWLLHKSVVLIISCLVVAFTSLAEAQQRMLRGTVVQITQGPPARIVVSSDSGNVTVTITETTILQRRDASGRTLTVKISDLRVGDQVLISVNEQSEALAVLVTASSSAEMPQPAATRRPQVGRVGVWVDSSVSPPVILVLEGSPAARAGLMTGDAILEIDGRPVQGAKNLAETGSAIPGTLQQWVVRRGSETLKVSVEVVDPSTLSWDATTYPHPPARVWAAISDVVTATDPLFPVNPPLRPIPFSRMFNVKNASRDLGIITFDTVVLGQPGSILDLLFYFGRDGLEQIFEIPKGGLMAVAVWDAIRIIPSMRVTERGSATSLRIGIAAEGWNSIVGWTPIKSRGVIEGATFVAILKRLR